MVFILSIWILSNPEGHIALKIHLFCPETQFSQTSGRGTAPLTPWEIRLSLWVFHTQPLVTIHRLMGVLTFTAISYCLPVRGGFYIQHFVAITSSWGFSYSTICCCSPAHGVSTFNLSYCSTANGVFIFNISVLFTSSWGFSHSMFCYHSGA